MSASVQAGAMAEIAAHAAADKLASNILILDVSERLVITECFIIASGSSERHVNAIVENIEEKLKRAGYSPLHREGAGGGRWALLDYADVVVHILHNDERHFYALERLWKDCPSIIIEGITS